MNTHNAMKTENELAADVEAAYRAKFSPEDSKLRKVQSFFEIRGLHARGKIGDCALHTAHRNALAAVGGANNK